MSSETRRAWSTLPNIDPSLTLAINALNFTTMTPVQTAAIPLFLQLKDVAAEAVTGSGKTLAFLVSMLEILLRRGRSQPWLRHEVGAIVISPTRELATQTHDVLLTLLRPHLPHITHLLLIGGSSVDDDMRALHQHGAHIIIATPGRLEDLLARRHDRHLSSSVRSLEFLVLDEADRLLDLGFHSTLAAILSYLPRQRRTGLFSATQTKEVAALVRAGLRNPIAVRVTETSANRSTPARLCNYYVRVADDAHKLRAILRFIDAHTVRKAIVFLPTCACVDYWALALPQLPVVRARHLSVFAVHGRMKGKRARALNAFRNTDGAALLLATDVLARGIDIPEVDWVLQWDPPSNAAAFVHRVGRTARSGAEGSAVVFLLAAELPYVDFIERNQNVRLTAMADDESDTTAICNELLASLRQLQMADRALMDAATTAFVSHVRAYSKHECSLLLRVKDLPLVQMALAYGLLQLPKMPELKHIDASAFTASSVDGASVAYKDKQREQARQIKLRQFEETGVWPKGKLARRAKPTVSWSRAKDEKAHRKDKRSKRKMAKLKMEGEAKKKRKRKGISDEEYAELARDVALLKKLKRKKISEEDFERAIGMQV